MGYTFPPLSLIGSNTNVADTALVSMIPSTDNEKSPLLLPKTHNLLISANPENNYLIEKRKLQLLASTFYRKNYLQKEYQTNLPLTTITRFRSVISAYHEPILGIPVTQSYRISAVFSGMFNKRPTQPKFTTKESYLVLLIY